MFIPPPAAPEPTPQQAAQQVTDRAYYMAVELLEKGLHPRDVKKKLVENGIEAETARGIVDDIVRPAQPAQLTRRELRDYSEPSKKWDRDVTEQRCSAYAGTATAIS